MLFCQLKSAAGKAEIASSGLVICLRGIGYDVTLSGQQIRAEQLSSMEPLMLDEHGFNAMGFNEAVPSCASQKFFGEAHDTV